MNLPFFSLKNKKKFLLRLKLLKMNNLKKSANQTFFSKFLTNNYNLTFWAIFILPIEGIEQPKGSQLEGKIHPQKPTAKWNHRSAVSCGIGFRVCLYWAFPFSTNPSKVPPCILPCHRVEKNRSPPGSTFFVLDPRTGNI